MDLKTALLVIVPSTITFIGGLTINRIKNSIIKVKRRITIFDLAHSQKDEFVGNLEIRHNNKKVKYLKAVDVELINKSNKDIEDFIIHINVEPYKILSCSASNDDTKVILEESKFYNKQVKNDNTEYLNYNRMYNASVLNRDTSISMELLIDSQKDDELDEEEILISIEKKGVKLVPYKSIDSSVFGSWAYGLGVLIIIITAIGCYAFFPTALKPIIIMGIIGAISILIGTVIFYTVKGWHHYNDDDE